MKLTDIILEAETDAPVKVVGLAPLDSDSNAAVEKATDEIEKTEKARVIRNRKAREAREKKKAATIKAIQEKAKKKAYDANRYIQKQLAKLNKTISDTYNEAFEKLSAEANSFAWQAIPYIIPNIVDRNIGSLRNEFVADYQQVGDSVKDPNALIPISAPMKARMKEWNAKEVPLYKAARKRAKEIEAEGNPLVPVKNNTIISPDNLMSNKDNGGRTYHQAPDGIYPKLAKMYATAWDDKCEEILSNEEWMGKLIDELAKQYFDDKKGDLPSDKPSTKGLDKLTTGETENLKGFREDALEVLRKSDPYKKASNIVEKAKKDIEDHKIKAKGITGAQNVRKGLRHNLNIMLTSLTKARKTAVANLKEAEDNETLIKDTFKDAIIQFAKDNKSTPHNEAERKYKSNVKALVLNQLRKTNNIKAIELVETAISLIKPEKITDSLFTGTLKSLLK